MVSFFNVADREEAHHPFSYFYYNKTTGEINKKHHFIQYGVYYKQLKWWLEYFPLRQIKFIDGTKFKQNPVPMLQEIEDFLGIPKYVQERHFKKSDKGFYCINSKTGCMPKSKGRKHPVVEQRILKVLYDFYQPWNEDFFKLLSRTFDWDFKG